MTDLKMVRSRHPSAVCVSTEHQRRRYHLIVSAGIGALSEQYLSSQSAWRDARLRIELKEHQDDSGKTDCSDD